MKAAAGAIFTITPAVSRPAVSSPRFAAGCRPHRLPQFRSPPLAACRRGRSPHRISPGRRLGSQAERVNSSPISGLVLNTTSSGTPPCGGALHRPPMRPSASTGGTRPAGSRDDWQAATPPPPSRVQASAICLPAKPAAILVRHRDAMVPFLGMPVASIIHVSGHDVPNAAAPVRAPWSTSAHSAAGPDRRNAVTTELRRLARRRLQRRHRFDALALARQQQAGAYPITPTSSPT